MPKVSVPLLLLSFFLLIRRIFSVSAASQAITSYIRSHMHRCQVEQDCPLLLKHVLSGTPSDDDLLPALYSRSGGAHCPPLENRLTNFRRGTTVWYLGRATGAPCPFARAGIRLCDYTESGKADPWDDPKDKKRQRDKHHRWDLPPACGQKRKRPLRGCVARNSQSASDSESPAEQPPPKVKLTLRLNLAKIRSSQTPQSCRPTDLSSFEDDDESMSVDSSEDDNSPKPKNEEEPWSLPPYPRRSISIPCYTPCSEGPYPSYFPSPSANTFKDPFRRSPSVARSVGSLPPDSDDDDFHLSMTRRRRDNVDEFGWDADLESEEEDEDEDETFESPGPRSPSTSFVPVVPDVTVKQEPKDVQGIIDEWDDLDSSAADAKVVAEALARAAAQVLHTEGLGKIKTESSDKWEWDPSRGLSYASEWGTPFEGISVKEEDLALDDLFTSDFPGSLSPHPLKPSFSSSFADIPYSDSPSPRTLDDDSPNTASSSATVRPRARTVPSSSVFNVFSNPSTSRPDNRPSITTTCSDSTTLPPPLSATSTLVSLIQSLSVHSPTTSSAPPSFTFPDIAAVHPSHPQDVPWVAPPQAVVVYTCQPCNPPISATQVEDISVYQMMLGENVVLRRIDTDFVNLSPILAFSGAPQPVLSAISNATVITKGSPVVSGTWVPLAAAQAHVRDHPLTGGLLDVFLSDTLYERFPTALQDFHRSNSQGRSLNQFGRHFTSTLRATHVVNGGERNSFTVCMPFALSAALGAERHNHEDEPPLSAQEQELFHELCVIPDWDKEAPASADTISMEVDDATKIATESILEVSSSKERKVLVRMPTETPPTSPLSPLSSIEESASEPPSPVASTVPVPSLKDMSVQERFARPLRRSKRVAAVAQSQPRTGSRRGTSRNSVS
ncbi:hypothetical protein BDQ17DRAFT_568954 [Cyathus striatus]|nr:hypothetical protein BDQ17DRAFT_568954 [Cyathus striatus]